MGNSATKDAEAGDEVHNTAVKVQTSSVSSTTSVGNSTAGTIVNPSTHPKTASEIGNSKGNGVAAPIPPNRGSLLRAEGVNGIGNGAGASSSSTAAVGGRPTPAAAGAGPSVASSHPPPVDARLSDGGGGRRPTQAVPPKEAKVGWYAAAQEGYQQIIEAIIRPPRAADYTERDLGPAKFAYRGRVFHRVDGAVTNTTGQKLVYSLWQPGDRHGKHVVAPSSASSSAAVGAGGGGGAAASATAAAAAVGSQQSQSTPAGQPKPCVVYLHGNSSCRAGAVVDCLLACLEEGACVCSFDFSGSGHSDGQWVTLGWHEQHDVPVIIDHLRSQHGITTIALWGRSMGAVTALLHASRDPLLAAVVCDSPFADLKRLCCELVGIGSESMGVDKRLLTLGLPVALSVVRRSVKSRSGLDIYHLKPIAGVGACQAPALFVAGQQDDFIVPAHSVDLHMAYGPRDADVYKCLKIVEGDHNSQRPAHFINFASGFLRRSLMIDAPFPLLSAVTSSSTGTSATLSARPVYSSRAAPGTSSTVRSAGCVAAAASASCNPTALAPDTAAAADKPSSSLAGVVGRGLSALLQPPPASTHAAGVAAASAAVPLPASSSSLVPPPPPSVAPPPVPPSLQLLSSAGRGISLNGSAGSMHSINSIDSAPGGGCASPAVEPDRSFLQSPVAPAADDAAAPRLQPAAAQRVTARGRLHVPAAQLPSLPGVGVAVPSSHTMAAGHTLHVPALGIAASSSSSSSSAPQLNLTQQLQQNRHHQPRSLVRPAIASPLSAAAGGAAGQAAVTAAGASAQAAAAAANSAAAVAETGNATSGDEAAAALDTPSSGSRIADEYDIVAAAGGQVLHGDGGASVDGAPFYFNDGDPGDDDDGSHSGNDGAALRRGTSVARRGITAAHVSDTATGIPTIAVGAAADEDDAYDASLQLALALSLQEEIARTGGAEVGGRNSSV